MPIDPSIPLQAVQPWQPYNPMQGIQAAEAVNQIRQQQAALQKQNALKSILSAPDALDTKTGLPTTNALTQISKLDPMLGFQMHGEVAKATNQQLETEAMQSEAFARKAEMQHGAVAQALETYDMDIEQGTPKDAALAKAQKVYSDARDELIAGGQLSDAEKQRMPTKFDPDTMKAASSKYLSWKEKREADKLAQRKEDAAEKKEDERYKESVRHDKAQEGIEGARLGLERQRVGIEAMKAKQAMSGGLSEEAVQGLAEQVLSGNKQALQGLGRGTQGATDLRRIENRVYELAKAKGLSGKDLANATAAFAGEMAASRAISVQNVKLSAVEGAAANAAQMYQDAYKDLGVTSNLKGLNEFVQSGQAATSDPKLKRALTAAQGLASEYASAMNRGGAPHVHDMEYARKLIVDAIKEGPAANDAMVKQIRAEIDGVARANKRAAEEAQVSDYNGKSAPPGKGSPTVSNW